MNSLQEFVEYVWDFYKPHSQLYPIKGLVKQDIYDAFYIYKRRLLKVSYNNPEYIAAYGKNYSWGDGDSLDRERVRDIILENPQLSWSS